MAEEEFLNNASAVDRISSFIERPDRVPHHISDEEAMQRLDDLKSGRVRGLSEAEFWDACGGL